MPAVDLGWALWLFEEGLSVSRRVGDRLPIRVSLYNLALTRQARGDLGGARELLGEGLSLSAEALLEALGGAPVYA